MLNFKSISKIISLIISMGLFSTCDLTYAKSDLVDIYKLAEKNDAILKQQLALYNATKKEKYIEGGDLLPQINLDANRGYNKITHITRDVELYTKTYNLVLEQILFDWAEWQQFLRTSPLITFAEKNWYLANQNLILRVSEAYLNILRAQDTLEFAQKEYEAINQLYQESTERFNVGEITRADFDQVKADLDSTSADVYQAKAELENNKDKLREIINTNIPELAPVKENSKLLKANPNSIEKWLEIARKYNLNLQAAHANRLMSEHDIKIAEAGYMPTAMLTARLRGSDSRRLLFNVASPTQIFVNSFRVGIDVTSPNLNPYGTIANVKKSKADYHRADQEFIEEYRNTEKLIKQYYRDIISFSNQLVAYKQAVKASQSALDATKEHFDLGDRTYVIVLERISDLYSAKRDFHNAIYDYILSLLRLEDAAGRLSIKDLIAVNSLLDTNKSTKKTYKKKS